MEFFILINYFLLGCYILNIFWLSMGFNKVKYFYSTSVLPQTKFSIIIPFRNEKDNLPILLKSIEKLNYPIDLFEVILVDDDSNEKFDIQNSTYKISLIDNLRKTNSPKKDAIYSGINVAKNNWIITTDADCIVNKDWLKILDAYIQKNSAKMIALGVTYTSQKSFLENFQLLDLMALQATTIGSFGNGQAFMCNGANFCYQKDFFTLLNGFQGNENIGSGDDVFLLQKAITYSPDEVHFIKNTSTIVHTKPLQSWKALFNQKVRWASKTTHYTSIYSKQLAIVVLLINISLIACLFSANKDLFIFIFSVKFLCDFILLKTTSILFNQSIKYFFISSFIYPFFSASVGLYSLIGKYNWKDRVYKK